MVCLSLDYLLLEVYGIRLLLKQILSEASHTWSKVVLHINRITHIALVLDPYKSMIMKKHHFKLYQSS